MELVGKKINFKVQRTETETPVLVSFPAGVPSGIEAADLSLTRKKSGNKVKQTLMCESREVLYRGVDFGSGGASSDAYNYAVGVYDKTTHTMTLIPAHHPFTMNRVPAVETGSDAVSSMTAWERRSALTEEFGSRKRKRAAKAAESNIISIENISGAAVVEANITEKIDAADEADIIPAAQVALSDQRLLLLPTFNEYATELPEAYPQDALIPDHLRTLLAAAYTAKLEQLTSENITVQSKEEWTSHFFPHVSGDFVSALIPEDIAHTMTKHKKSCRARTCELLYLDILLNFYTAVNKSSTTKKEEIMSTYAIPSEILDHVAQNFAVIKKIRKEDAYQRNKQNSQKTLLAAMALALHLGNYELNLTLLAGDLKSTVPNMQALARSLGCFASKRKVDGADVSFAELKLPLKFPEPSKGKK